MILFKKDWEEHPYAIPDYETKNQSFLRLAGLLKYMGIENNTFLLALHDTTLKGIDPHDESLPPEIIHKIAIECNVNPWYFFREVMRLPPPSGVNPVMLRANRANISAVWLFFNHMTYMLLQPRQTGKSAIVQGIFTWLLQIATINNTIAILTKDDVVRKDGIEKIKGIMEYLPRYLDLRTRKDSNNTENITILNLGNKLQTLVPNASKARASNVGRGMTITSVNIDEFAFVQNIEEILGSLMPTLTAAREVAKDIDAPYGTIFTTTPGYLSTVSGKYAYNFYNGCYRWNEILFDSHDRNELESVIIKNSPCKKPYILLEYNHRQLGFTDEWLKEQITNSVLSPQQIESEFLLIWGDATETSPLSKDVIATLKQNIRYDFSSTISEYGYVTRWYITNEELENIIKTRHIIIGLDTSDAVGSDEIGLVMRDSYNAEVIAVGNFNETNLIVFSQWICDLLLEFENSVLVIERKSSGVVIIDNLILLLLAKGQDPFKRIFNWIVNDCNANPKYKEILDIPFYRRDRNVYEIYRSKFGFATTASGRQGRDKLYGAVFNASTKYTAYSVRDKQLTSQLLSLEVRNGRIDHKNGGKDDMCFTGDMLVRTINGNIPIKDLNLGDLVLTRQGYKPIVKIFKREAEVITKYGITGTPDHPFITPKGIVKFKDIKDEDEIYIWKDKLLNTIAKNITDIQSSNDTKTKKEIVYNLTIDECHEYFVNDVLVHNCVGWLLAFWFLSYAENKKYYGINPQLVMINVNNFMIDEQGGIEEIERKNKHEETLKEITNLVEDFSTSKDEVNRYVLLNKIRKLYEELNDYKVNVNTLNIDQLIDNIKTLTKLT